MSTATATATRGKFCRWCYNANLPESVYTSHYVRESQHPDSDVVCRNLLKHRCSACNCYGHSRGNCAVVDTTNDRRQREYHRPHVMRNNYVRASNRHRHRERDVDLETRHQQEQYAMDLQRRSVYVDENGWHKWVCCYTGEVMHAPPPLVQRQTNATTYTLREFEEGEIVNTQPEKVCVMCKKGPTMKRFYNQYCSLDCVNRDQSTWTDFGEDDDDTERMRFWDEIDR